MNWRQWIGLTPTQADLANDLLRAGRQTGWVYDAANSDTHGGEELFMNQYTHVWRWDREGIFRSVKNRKFFPQPPWTGSRRSGKALHDPGFVYGIYVCSCITTDLIAFV